MQNLLRRRLPEGTTYNDPDTFHVTLVMVEDDKGIDLLFDEIASGLPVFGLSGDYLTTFERGEGARAVHLRIERTTQLIYLQSSIYYRAMALGAKISEHSYPSRWRAHITLATLPADPTRDGFENRVDTFMESSVNIQVDRIAVSEGGDFTPVKEWPLLIDVPVQEFLEQMQPNVETQNGKIMLMEQSAQTGERVQVELTCVSEMKGGIPNIKLPEDIDVAAIQARGMKFVTLPIGQAGARSRNGRTYTAPAYTEMVEQINANRPEGGWGHIKEEDLGTSYAPPAIRWLRAEITKDGTVWGKGVPLTEEANNYFELARATNSRVGTSLHAWVNLTEEEEVTGMELIRLDLADPARVGVPMTAALPQLSTEMENETDAPPARLADSGATASPSDESTDEGEAIQQLSELSQEENPVDDDKKRVTELETERRTLNEQIAGLEKTIKTLSNELADAKDVYRVVGIVPSEGMDIVKAARLFKEMHDDLVAENTSLLGDSIAAIVKEKVVVESVQPIIAKMVRDQKPVTRKALTNAFEQVMADTVVKELIAAKLAAESGPAQPPPAGNQNAGDDKVKSHDYLVIPEGVVL
ncbi:MAG: hypothetical protein WBO46_02735, partial [Caldilineaceae bacterium]